MFSENYIKIRKVNNRFKKYIFILSYETSLSASADPISILLEN